MKYLKIIICFLFFPLTANGKADQDSIRLALKHMEDGLKTKEIAVAQKSCIRFVETDYGSYNFPIYPTRLEGDENKGKRHQSGGPFHIGRRTEREEHDSFQ